MFAHIRHKNSLRDIDLALNPHADKLYHLGIQQCSGLHFWDVNLFAQKPLISTFQADARVSRRKSNNQLKVFGFQTTPLLVTELKTPQNLGLFSCQNYTLRHPIFSNPLIQLDSKPDSSGSAAEFTGQEIGDKLGRYIQASHQGSQHIGLRNWNG